MKKFFLAWCGLIFALSLSSFVFAQTQIYPDVASDFVHYKAVQFITQEGVISGYPDGTYRPYATINRAEILKILMEAKYTNEFEFFKGSSCFPDILKDDWFTKYVCFAKDRGIVQGYPDNTFRPGQKVNFVEALKMAMKTYEYSYNENLSLWYEDIVRKAATKNLIPLDMTDFSQQLSRGQMADMIARFIKEKDGTLEDYLSETPLYKGSTYKVTYESLQKSCYVPNDPSCIGTANMIQSYGSEYVFDPSLSPGREGALAKAKAECLVDNLKIKNSNQNDVVRIDSNLKYIFELDTSNTTAEKANCSMPAVFCEIDCKTGETNVNWMCGDKLEAQQLAFEPSTVSSKCLGITHNNTSANRINMVFLGMGYSDLDIVKEIVSGFIDYKGTGNGLFSVEPYKLMKDKFNFWLSKDIFYEEEHESFLAKQRYDFNMTGAKKLVTDNCPLDNTVLVVPVRYPSCSSGGSGEIWMSVAEEGLRDYKKTMIEAAPAITPYANFIPEGNYPYLRNTLLMVSYAPTFLHEMGHIFGLRNEYVNFETFDDPLSSDVKNAESKNCFVAKSKSECEANAPWKELLGEGSGFTEIGCYEGCNHYEHGIYRGVKRSLMNAVEGMYYEPGDEVDEGEYVYAEPSVIKYGGYSESLIKDAILKMLQ